MKIKIKRQDSPDTLPYWQTFIYDKNQPETVAGILDHLNYRDDLIDENGTPTRRIRWDCSCLQKMCGACAMIINHKPALACSTFIYPDKTDELILEPLTKFPVISDLSVDRSCIHEALKKAESYRGEASTGKPGEYVNRYNAAKCLKCGLCLEVCPNYTGKGNFFGAVWANEAYLMHSTTANRRKPIKKQYRLHFERGCSKSLACVNICPMKLSTLASIGYMNRIF